jgi:hypothetical protein
MIHQRAREFIDTDIGVVGLGHPTIRMPVTRRTVLERLAAASDAARQETTTIEALASALDADEHVVLDVRTDPAAEYVSRKIW